MAALPVGSMEVMGPHLPVGSKMFAAKALAEALCKEHGGLCLPAIPLSPITGAKDQGGVDIDCQVLLDYIYDVTCEVFDNGIRRLLIVGSFDELYYIVAETLQLLDIPAVHIDPLALPLYEESSHKRYNAVTAGSLKLLGEDELLAKMLAANEKCLKEGGYRAPDDEPPIKGLISVTGSTYPSGVFPHFYGANEYKILPTAGIDADMAADAINKWVTSQADALTALAKYIQLFPRTKHERGLRTGGVGFED